MNKKYSSENAYDSMMVGMNQYFSIMKLPTYVLIFIIRKEMKIKSTKWLINESRLEVRIR